MENKRAKIITGLLYASVFVLLIASQWAHLSLVEMAAVAFIFLMSRSAIMAFLYDEEFSWGYGVIPAGREKSHFTRAIGLALALGLFAVACSVVIFLN